MVAMLNPFDAGGYTLAEMTEAINILPNVYSRLGQMGLFRFEGVTQRSVVIEQAEGVLNLLPTVPLGGPATVANRDLRSMRSFTIPWIPHDDAITPQDIQGVRGFGMSDAADPLATVMERKLTRMRVKHAQTREYMEVNALRGIVKDGAGVDPLRLLHRVRPRPAVGRLRPRHRHHQRPGEGARGAAQDRDRAQGRDDDRRAGPRQSRVLRQADRPCQGRGRLQVLLLTGSDFSSTAHVGAFICFSLLRNSLSPR